MLLASSNRKIESASFEEKKGVKKHFKFIKVIRIYAGWIGDFDELMMMKIYKIMYYQNTLYSTVVPPLVDALHSLKVIPPFLIGLEDLSVIFPTITLFLPLWSLLDPYKQ